MLRYEHLHQPLATAAVFYARMARSLALALGLIAASLFVGMAGYHHYQRLSWIDSFVNASMILSGMGPLVTLDNGPAKLFAGGFAIYSGLFLIFIAGVILAPALHRLLHSLHIDDEDEKAPKAKAAKRS